MYIYIHLLLSVGETGTALMTILNNLVEEEEGVVSQMIGFLVGYRKMVEEEVGEVVNLMFGFWVD